MSRLFFIQQDRRECIDIGLELTIGRSYSNRLRLEGADISRAHAIIYRRGDEFIVRDLDSKNGVIVNGERLAKRTLERGDVINISHYTMIFDPPDTVGIPESQATEPAIETHVNAASDTAIRKRHQRFAMDVLRQSFTESHVTQTQIAIPHAGAALRFAYGAITRLENIIGAEAVCKAALDWMAELFMAHRGAIFVREKGAKTPRTLAAFDLVKHGEIQAHPKVLQWLFEREEALISVEVSAAAKPANLEGVDHANRMAMPLMIAGGATGFIYLENDPPAPPFTIEEMQRLYCVSLIVSRLIEREKIKGETTSEFEMTLKKI